MNNIAATLAATKPFNFVLAPVAAQNRTVSCVLIVAAQIAFLMLGLAVSHSLGAQMQAMKGFEALTFGFYLVAGSGFTASLYLSNKRARAAIAGSATSVILAFLGGLLLA